MRALPDSELYGIISRCARRFSEDDAIDPDSRAFADDIRMNSMRISQILRSIEDHADGEKPISILEIGIGYAYVTTALSAALEHDGGAIFAVEHPGRRFLESPEFRDHLDETGVTLATADIVREPLPYDPSTFDVAIFSETLEHIPPSRLRFVLREISRVLNVGGRLICSSPNLGALKVRWKLLRGKSPFDPALPLSGLGGDTFGHIRLYTVDEMRSLCGRFDLVIEQVRYMNYGIVGSRSFTATLTRWLSGLFPALSHDFLFTARKEVR